MGKNASHVFGSIRSVSDTRVEFVLSSGVYLEFEIPPHQEATLEHLRLTRKWKYGMSYGDVVSVHPTVLRRAREVAVQKIAHTRHAKRIPHTPKFSHLWGQPRQLALAFT